MVKLAGRRLIRPAKITGYLLNPSSSTGGAGKAKFFTSFGFSGQKPEQLEGALQAHAAECEVAYVERTEYGVKSIVRCCLQTPDGKNPCILSVWIQDHGADEQRFVTAYPST